MNREEIRENLLCGDYEKIARKVGAHKNFVGMVIRGERKSRKGKGKKIMEEAEKIAKFNIDYLPNKNQSI